MAEWNHHGAKEARATIEIEVGNILEQQFRMDLNTKDKILSGYFSQGYLPEWYYFSNSPDTIAHHIYMLSQFLNANTDMISQSSSDGGGLTCFVNIGRDTPGRLHSIFEENAEMDIVSYDSEMTASGLRIVSLERRGDYSPSLSKVEQQRAETLYKALRDGKNSVVSKDQHQLFTDFFSSLRNSYLREEITVGKRFERVRRHWELFCRAGSEEGLIYQVSRDPRGGIRISIAAAHPGSRFVSFILKGFVSHSYNLGRSYYDEFGTNGTEAGIFSAYLELAEEEALELCRELERQYRAQFEPGSSATGSDSGRFDQTVEQLIRELSSDPAVPRFQELLVEIEGLIDRNLNPEQEYGNFYLNCLTDFYEAVRFLGLDKQPEKLKQLLGFESFEEFFVSSHKNGQTCNIPGYRIRHSRKRGPAKGGLRIDPIADFSEVAALSFMMTWKSARSGILFGGAKGGLMLNAREFDRGSLELADSLSSFGRSLFLVTGPAMDVPAGDVGCGPDEIGRLFDGFKSALRDLALMVYGVKNNVSMIGDRIISLEEARALLKEAFDIDYHDTRLLKELSGNHEYLERVAAAQVTGKPKMGIQARNGATGRGLVYSTLAAVANLYLDNRWSCDEHPDKHEEKLLQKLCGLTLDQANPADEDPFISNSEWKKLQDTVFPKLLKGKKIVIQGSGKVGSSVMKELRCYGVNLIAVADAGGAIVGDQLDPDELLEAVEKSRNVESSMGRASVIHAEKGVSRVIRGAAEGAEILELPCDILYPAALENAVNGKNAAGVQAVLEVCGSNGSNSSAAEKILQENGVAVVYDFLANSGGVVASYFEWLRNLEMRYRYEAEKIKGETFDPAVLDKYIMKPFLKRVHNLLSRKESDLVTEGWNLLMRDIIFAALNEDYHKAGEEGISMKCAGFVHAIERVLGQD